MLQKDNIYIESLTDKEIVDAILRRDARITRLYLYELCYPLFKARFDKYFTDCETCLEFINDIYIYIMTPSKRTGKCYLDSFGFECRFMRWLKIVAENYCYQKFKKKMPIVENPDGKEGCSDRKAPDPISPDINAINQHDVEIVLGLMPNKRYRSLIQLRYVEDKTNEETAEILGMSMDNYYNKHKLAKEQFVSILRKEGLV